MAKTKVLRFINNLLVGACLLFIMSACSTLPVDQSLKYSREVRSRFYNLAHWSFEGRMALTNQSDSWSANIYWEHSPEAEQVKLFGPFGQGAVIIKLRDNVVTIDRGGNDVQTSANPEEFVNQQLGMFIPIRSLRFWAIGLPEPSQSFHDVNAGFTQAGWLAEYKEMDYVEDAVMPRKLMVIKDNVKLKLIVDHWILNDKKAN